jgi:hypothetical protein
MSAMGLRDLRAEAQRALDGEKWEDSGAQRRPPDPQAATALAILHLADVLESRSSKPAPSRDDLARDLCNALYGYDHFSHLPVNSELRADWFRVADIAIARFAEVPRG